MTEPQQPDENLPRVPFALQPFTLTPEEAAKFVGRIDPMTRLTALLNNLVDTERVTAVALLGALVAVMDEIRDYCDHSASQKEDWIKLSEEFDRLHQLLASHVRQEEEQYRGIHT